jgi:hypothetical protein
MMATSLPAPPGITQPPPVKAGLWSKLRIPVLIASILFLLFSIASSVIVPRLQEDDVLPSPLIDLFVRHQPPGPSDAERAYAARLRADAQRLAGEGDPEDALARLDQAAQHDMPGDRAAEIQRMRRELRARIGEVLDNTAQEAPKSHE